MSNADPSRIDGEGPVPSPPVLDDSLSENLTRYYLDDTSILNMDDSTADEDLPTDGTGRSFADIEQFLENGDWNLRALADAIKDSRPLQLEDLQKNLNSSALADAIKDSRPLQLEDLQKNLKCFQVQGKCIRLTTNKQLTEVPEQLTEVAKKGKGKTMTERKRKRKESEEEQEGESCDLEEQIRFCIDTMYPDLCTGEAGNNEFAKNQVRELQNLVKKMVTTHRHGKAGEGTAHEGGVEVILKCLQEVFPNRTYYHLLTRWARRSKVDYVKEVMIVLIALNSQFPNQTLPQFLDKCRDWRMTCPFEKGKRTTNKDKRRHNRMKLRMAFVQRSDIPKFENIVTRTDASLQICGLEFSKQHEHLFASTRMASTKKKRKVCVSSTPSEDGHVARGANTNHPAYELEVEASLGTHVPHTFRSRLWLTIEFVKLGYELCQFIFKDKIIEAKLFNNFTLNDDEKVLQFLFQYMADQGSRWMWVKALADICLTIPRLDGWKAGHHDNDVLPVFYNNKPHLLPPHFNNTGSTKDICAQIMEAYRYFDPNHNKTEPKIGTANYRHWKKHSKNKKQPTAPIYAEHCYQALRANVFRHYLSFARNASMRTRIDAELYPDSVQRKKNKKTIRTFSLSADTNRIEEPYCGPPLSAVRPKCPYTLPSVGGAPQLPPLSTVPEPEIPPLLMDRPDCPYTLPSVGGALELPTVGLEQSPYDGHPLPINPNVRNETVHENPNRNVPDGNVGENPNPNVPDGKVLDGQSSEGGGKENPQVHGGTDKAEGRTSTIELVTYDMLKKDQSRFEGKEFKIISLPELKKRIDSRLYVKCKRLLVCLRLAPLEVYSATGLADLDHWRTTCDLQLGKTSPVNMDHQAYLNVGMDETYFIDPNDNVSVVRPGSGVWERCNLEADLKVLLRYIVNYGTDDGTEQTPVDGTKRRQTLSSKVFEFGVKPELETNDGKQKVYGTQYFSPRVGETKSDKELREMAQWSLGNCVQFVWDVMEQIQKASKKPSQGGIPFRDKQFGGPVRDILGPGCWSAEFEACTVVHSILSVLEALCTLHKDKLNDLIYMYSKTGCLNAVLVDAKGTIHLLQILCNFRGAARDKLAPGAMARIESIVSHFRHYETYLREYYINMLVKSEGGPKAPQFFMHPHDMSDFSLHPGLPYEKLNLFPTDSSKDSLMYDPIEEDFLVLPIGTSRWLSLSGMIEPIVGLGDHLCRDQLVEIAFLASFLSTHVQFNYSIRQIKSTLIEEDIIHPFFPILQDLNKRFPSWRGGIHPRYNCCNDSLINIIGFGEEVDDPETKKNGAEKLKAVVESLLSWIEYINSLQGLRTAAEIPYDDLRNRMMRTVTEIQEACPPTTTKTGEKGTRLDFGLFRLSVLTTILTGCGLVQPGPHLYQLNILAVTAASLHLEEPNAELTKEMLEAAAERAMEEDAKRAMEEDAKRIITEDGTPAVAALEEAVVANESKYQGVKNHPDILMAFIASQMGWPLYRRVLVENYLCESKGSRLLYKAEVYRKGQTLYDVRLDEGIPMYKEYGKTLWKAVPEPKKKGLKFACMK